MAFRFSSKKLLRFLVILVILVIAGAIILLSSGILNSKQPFQISASRLSCTDNDSVRAFGNRVLYYDGSSIYCFTSNGAEIWRFDIGEDAWFDCNEDTIVAWRGTGIYVLNSNGESTYSDSLDETVQFARVGKQYIGAVVGDTTEPRLIVKDHTGAHMDEESDAYSGLILLNLGFYGSNGQYMWTLSLDVYGTAANTILNTFEVGKMNTCEASLGSPICYGVVYESGNLNVINTRKIRVFTDKGTEDTSKSKLVYGWHYLCSLISERGTASYLFAPESQTNSGQYEIRELRLLKGSTDKRYSLPETCIGAMLYGNYLYAISPSKLYRASADATRFESWDLPGEVSPLSLIGTLTGGKAIVSCGDAVYTITLPD